jgi:hypothetical protein
VPFGCAPFPQRRPQGDADVVIYVVNPQHTSPRSSVKSDTPPQFLHVTNCYLKKKRSPIAIYACTCQDTCAYTAMSMFMSVSISMYASVCIYIIYISLLYISEVHSILYIYLYLQPAYHICIILYLSLDPLMYQRHFFIIEIPSPKYIKVLHPTRWVCFILWGRDY